MLPGELFHTTEDFLQPGKRGPLKTQLGSHPAISSGRLYDPDHFFHFKFHFDRFRVYHFIMTIIVISYHHYHCRQI